MSPMQRSTTSSLIEGPPRGIWQHPPARHWWVGYCALAAAPAKARRLAGERKLPRSPTRSGVARCCTFQRRMNLTWAQEKSVECPTRRGGLLRNTAPSARSPCASNQGRESKPVGLSPGPRRRGRRLCQSGRKPRVPTQRAASAPCVAKRAKWESRRVSTMAHKRQWRSC